MAVWDAFCPSCGYRSEQAAYEQHGDISRGTILFASLDGVEAPSEHLPPAGPFRDLLSEPVIRHDGSVNKYAGEAILAYFPTRRGRETNAVRAIEAGLEMQEALKRFATERAIPVTMRIGISTGLVLAAEAGSRAAGKFTLIGSAVDLASNLGREADPGSILVEEDTYRLAEHAFEFSAKPSMAVRGRFEMITPFVPLRRAASIPR
jgi:class 3 adenylate cyclase